MQLPRGTFRDIKRESGLHSLISHMEEVSLSGYCKIISDETPILLVFRNGTIILAECGALKGPAALEQISYLGDRMVDVVLHDLNDTQLGLALEFNPSCTFPEGGPARGRGTKPLSMPREGTIDPQSRQPEIGRTASAERGARPHPGVPAAPEKTMLTPPAYKRGTEEEVSLLMRELDSLDRLDIESMTEKFRANCRLMIEKLDLEYLLEQNSGKENHDCD